MLETQVQPMNLRLIQWWRFLNKRATHTQRQGLLGIPLWLLMDELPPLRSEMPLAFMSSKAASTFSAPPRAIRFSVSAWRASILISTGSCWATSPCAELKLGRRWGKVAH